MRSPFAPIVALLALGILIFVAARHYPAAIEADLAARAAAALEDAGLEAVSVSADGRDVRLTGSVPGELARARANRIAGAVPGIRRIRNDIDVQDPGAAAGAGASTAAAQVDPAPPVPSRESGRTAGGPWQTRIRVSETELVIEGDAPTPEFREQLTELVPERFPGLAVRDCLSVRPDGAGGDAGAALEAALAALPAFVEGEAVLRDTRLAVSGRLRPGVVPGQVEEQIRQALPGAYSLDFRLDPRPVARGNTGDSNAGSQPAETATGRRPDRPACQAAVDEVLAEGGIVFAFGSVELDPAARDLLDRVAARLLDCPGQQVEVGGHTDSAGDAEVNRRVSEARALAVTRYLVRAGVPEARLTAVGHGETRPVADNSTPDGRRQNRRIEFRVTE